VCVICGWWCLLWMCFFFSRRRRHTRLVSDWSSDVCSSDLHHALTSSWRAKAGRKTSCAKKKLERDDDSKKGHHALSASLSCRIRDRKSVVEGKRVDIGGAEVLKKKKRRKEQEDRREKSTGR